ncbi:MAG TPA: PilW family protein [Steroidobacteraceae bacterium]|nr:PilW family protein [Steroidobacteraceae bacterium]
MNRAIFHPGPFAGRPSASPRRARVARQAGFTLIELMIALLIGLFLIGGLLTLVQAMKRTSTVQNGLSQLQENERLAMTLVTNVVQSTGYFPDPLNNSQASEFPAAGAFVVSQALYGTGTGTLDTISVRYATSGTDNVMDCSGNTQTAAATLTNLFSLDAHGDLQCTLTVGAGAPALITLVSGLTNIAVLYGVQTNSASGNNSIDTYLNANQVTAGNYWPDVISVEVALTFTNPLYGQPGQTNQTITFRRVIDLMNKAGVNT